jgi:hypothetical protein
MRFKSYEDEIIQIMSTRKRTKNKRTFLTY